MVKKQKTEIDFSKYRTPDLVTTIADIISLPGAVKSIFYWAFYGLLGLVFLVWACLWLSGSLNLFWTAIIELYAAPAGTIGGIAIGCAELVRRSLNSVRKLVNLLLDTTAQVTSDLGGLSSGEKEMPPARDLVNDVYEQVILITLREACYSVFGFLGRPVYWFYHITLNRLVRLTINCVVSNNKIEVSAPKVLHSTLGAVGSIAKEDGRVVSSLRWTQWKLDSLGGWIKILVLTPCYCVLALVIAAILAPLTVVWWLFSQRGVPKVPAEAVEAATAMLSWLTNCS